MADRNSIIDKIKALLAKTTANGATEAEMMSALDKASAMMDAYDITDAELQVATASLNSAACRFIVHVARPALSASVCRATCNLRCGCSTALLTSCSQNSMGTSSAASHQRVSAVSSLDRSRQLAVIAS